MNSQVNTPAESQSLMVMVWTPSVCDGWPQCPVKILRIFTVLVVLGKAS